MKIYSIMQYFYNLFLYSVQKLIINYYFSIKIMGKEKKKGREYRNKFVDDLDIYQKWI